MKHHRVALPVVALAVGLASAAPAQDAPIDRERALTAPVEDLARESLLAIAPQFVEVTRPTFVGLLGPRESVSGLFFATRARSAGFPGLCAATVAQVGAGLAEGPIKTWQVFKVVDSLEPLPDTWNEAYGARLDAKCEAAGRVIRTGSADFEQQVFFGASGITSGGGQVRLRAYDAWRLARVLQHALRDTPGRPTPTCTPGERPERCGDPVARASALSIDALGGLSELPCPDGAGTSCLTASFVRSSEANTVLSWILRIEATAATRDEPPKIKAITVSTSEVIHD